MLSFLQEKTLANESGSFDVKMLSYKRGNSHYKEKIVSLTSCLYKGNLFN